MGHGLFWRILRRFCGGGFGDIGDGMIKWFTAVNLGLKKWSTVEMSHQARSRGHLCFW